MQWQRFTIAKVHPRLFQIGALAIPTAGAVAALAIVAALLMARTSARRLELNPEKVWDLGITAVLAALFAPRLVLVFANWRDFLAHPLWMIGVLRVRSESAIFAGVAIAVIAVCLFVVLARMPFRATLDALAPSLALGFAIADIGAFLGGANFGTPTNKPWAVAYTSRLASLWYGTPLGTPLHPTQMYMASAELCIFVLLMAAIARPGKWRLRDGEILGAWLFLHGLGGFSLNFLRGDLAMTDANRFLGDQGVAAILVLAGGLLWVL